MNDNKKTSIIRRRESAEYLKIRKFVIDSIYQYGGESQPVASTRELARQFGVSGATVQKALRELVADGLLVTRPGIGTFTNPEAADFRSRKIFGLISGNGKIVYYDNYIWKLQAAAGEGITRSLGRLYMADTLDSNERLFDDLRQLNLDGLVWVGPAGNGRLTPGKLKAELGVPVVAINCDDEEIATVNLDFEQEGYEVGLRLIREERSRVVIVLKGGEVPEKQLTGLRRAFASHGLTFNDSLVIEHHHSKTAVELGRIIDIGVVPQAVYALGGSRHVAVEVLEGRGIDLMERCRLISDYEPGGRTLPQWLIEYDPAPVADAVELLMARQLEGKAAEHIRIPRTISTIYEKEPQQ